MTAKFEKHSLKTVRVVDYTNSIPYSTKMLPKSLSSKGRNSIKFYSSSIQNPHAQFQCINNMSAKSEKHSLKTIRWVDYTKSIPYGAKTLPKWLSSKARNPLKNNYMAIKDPHAHFHYVHSECTRFHKDPLKTVWGVDYTNFIPYYAKNCLKQLSSKGRNSLKIISS